MAVLYSGSSTEGVEQQDDLELVGHLLSIAKTVRQLQAIVLVPIGVAVGQDQFLLILLQNGSQMSSTVAQALNVRPSTVSKMTDICERKGWVRRSVEMHDLRRAYLDLTDAGVLMAHKVQSATAVFEKELASLFANYADVPFVIKQMDAVLPKMLKRLR